mmetsp:Transcript_8428/g.17538  ORF Transcript_8428/g.17538 Transcript_8428/m.17538 type:complete len:1129 (+) Transcript_8428:123-3509(+)
MTEPNGTTGKGSKTMKKSDAATRSPPVDTRTSTASTIAGEQRPQTTANPKPAVKGLQTNSGSSNRAAPTQIVANVKKAENSVPVMQINGTGGAKKIDSSSSMPSSKPKKLPGLQTKEQTTGHIVINPRENQIIIASKPPAPVSLLEGKNNSGNDRVTIDKRPNKPLVPRAKIGPNVRNPGNAKATNRVVSSLHPVIESTVTKTKAKPSMAATLSRQKPPMGLPSSSNPVSTKKPLIINPSSSHTAANRSQATSASNSDIDESMISLGDDEVQRQRAPLTEKYNPYITHSDKSLEDARHRLQTALDQTRQLRAAFTERVYGKYRVCLQPPPQTPDIIKALTDNPSGMYRKLELERKLITNEKSLEKKEFQKINSSDGSGVLPSSTASTSTNVPPAPNSTSAGSIGASNNNGADDKKATATATATAVSNPENSEKYFYVTSGLSLIVLPEDNISKIDMGMYRDRAPVNPKTGQRVRGISAAAATSGKVMLERARQGKLARADREKRSQQQVGQQAHNFFDRHYYSTSSKFHTMGTSAGQTAATTTTKQSPTSTARNPSSTMQKPKPKVPPQRSRGLNKAADGKKTGGAKRTAAPKNNTKVPAGQTAAGAKAIRARVQTPMSVQTLLNLNPIHEELRTDTKYSAATLGMMERGVGTFQGPTTQYHKNTPHRFKHPFPDSLGGRRRPVTRAGGAVNSSTVSNDQLMLPPIPSVKECRRHKKISVLSRAEAGTTRATSSIRQILNQFTPSANKAAVTVESNITQENSLFVRPKKQRRISEIGFVRGLYLNNLDEGRARKGIATTSANGTESGNNDSVGIDSTLTLNVLKAVGLIKSSISNDSTSEKSAFQTSLTSSLFKEIPSTDLGPYSESISKLKSLEHKLSTQKRSFTSAFCSDSDELGIENVLAVQNTQGRNFDQKVEFQSKASAPLSLRGGGSGSNSDGKESVKSQEQKGDNGKNSKIGKSPNRKPSISQNQVRSVATTQAQALMRQNMMREEALHQQQQQRLAQLQLQARLQSADHFRQSNNALQLANQLRVSSRIRSGPNDFTDYIGGLHHSPQAHLHRWSQAAALGLNTTGVMSLEDQRAFFGARAAAAARLSCMHSSPAAPSAASRCIDERNERCRELIHTTRI